MMRRDFPFLPGHKGAGDQNYLRFLRYNHELGPRFGKRASLSSIEIGYRKVERNARTVTGRAVAVVERVGTRFVVRGRQRKLEK